MVTEWAEAVENGSQKPQADEKLLNCERFFRVIVQVNENVKRQLTLKEANRRQQTLDVVGCSFGLASQVSAAEKQKAGDERSYQVWLLLIFCFRLPSADSRWKCATSLAGGSDTWSLESARVL